MDFEANLPHKNIGLSDVILLSLQWDPNQRHTSKQLLNHYMFKCCNVAVQQLFREKYRYSSPDECPPQPALFRESESEESFVEPLTPQIPTHILIPTPVSQPAVEPMIIPPIKHNFSSSQSIIVSPPVVQPSYTNGLDIMNFQNSNINSHEIQVHQEVKGKIDESYQSAKRRSLRIPSLPFCNQLNEYDIVESKSGNSSYPQNNNNTVDGISTQESFSSWPVTKNLDTTNSLTPQSILEVNDDLVKYNGSYKNSYKSEQYKSNQKYSSFDISLKEDPNNMIVFENRGSSHNITPLKPFFAKQVSNVIEQESSLFDKDDFFHDYSSVFNLLKSGKGKDPVDKHEDLETHGTFKDSLGFLKQRHTPKNDSNQFLVKSNTEFSSKTTNDEGKMSNRVDLSQSKDSWKKAYIGSSNYSGNGYLNVIDSIYETESDSIYPKYKNANFNEEGHPSGNISLCPDCDCDVADMGYGKAHFETSNGFVFQTPDQKSQSLYNFDKFSTSSSSGMEQMIHSQSSSIRNVMINNSRYMTPRQNNIAMETPNSMHEADESDGKQGTGMSQYLDYDNGKSQNSGNNESRHYTWKAQRPNFGASSNSMESVRMYIDSNRNMARPISLDESMHTAESIASLSEKSHQHSASPHHNCPPHELSDNQADSFNVSIASSLMMVQER